jgi:tetratricopeptide (TPR) repeat protein
MDKTMKDDNMILASMNPTVSTEQPGLFSKWFETADRNSSEPKSTCSQTKKQVKDPNFEPIMKRKGSSPKRQHDAPPEQIGKGMSDMAEGQAQLGHYDKAFELWNEALKLQKATLGSRHVTVAHTLASRGSAFAHQSQWYPAVLDLEAAAHIYRSKDDDEHASDILIQLAIAQERMGYLDEAVATMHTALALKEKLHDEKSVARLNCLIGNVYHQQRDFERALESYRRGLEGYEQAGVEKSHPDVVWAKRRAEDRSIQGHLFWGQASNNAT